MASYTGKVLHSHNQFDLNNNDHQDFSVASLVKVYQKTAAAMKADKMNSDVCNSSYISSLS
jgi:hypothetical protein